MASVMNNLTDTRHTIDECNQQVILFNGFDRPRYHDPINGHSGYLGIADWGTYVDKPTGVASAGGSLSTGKFYSIKVVPVDADIVAGGFPIQGNATLPSQPVEVSGGDLTVDFTVPVHSQMKTEANGTAEDNSVDNTIVTTGKTYGLNQWAGYTCTNIETGLTDTIASNTTGGVLTLDNTLDFDADARFQIQSPSVTARYVYVAEMAAIGDLTASVFYLSGVIADNTTPNYELTSFAQGEIFVGDYYVPPNAFTCHVSGGIVYAGGGITVEGVGTVEWNGTDETKSALSTVVTLIDDDYASAGTAQILRYTLSAGSFTALYKGSRVTVTGATSTAGNNIADAKVLRVDSGGTWFEIENNDGGAQTEAVTIVMTPNVMVGTSTAFSEGMVDARIEFLDDTAGSFSIAWVDTINQTIGLNTLYDGGNSATTALYRIKSTYNLYYSDYKNPHRYRSVSLVEIGDEILGLYALGRNLLVFCDGSLWRHNMLEPGAAPQMLTDSIFFDATWSICSNGSIVLFYDGEGISATDGVTVRSLTALKGRDYMQNVNKSLADQIQGIYNPTDRRFEFAMPMGTETNNNYGLYITEDSFNNVPVSRVDANVLFSGYEDGEFKIFHGTSGNLQADDAGIVWTHDGTTDGLVDTAFETTITDITGQVVTVSADTTPTWAAGDVVLFYPAGSGNYRQAMISSMDGTKLILTFDDDYDLTLFEVGDNCLFGMIPFDYGIKWNDFGSPMYLKRVRQMQIDLYGMNGNFYMDHYLDLSESAVQNDSRAVVPTDSKLVIPFRMGKGYQYGFRIRGYSSTEFKVNSIIYIDSVKA